MTTEVDAPRVLGLCASLRAGRWADGTTELVRQIRGLADRDALMAFLEEQSLAHFENFVNAGRSEGLPFDELYANLKKEVGKRGLSNSEVALAAGLWAAHDLGCDIEWASLVEHFPPSGRPVKLDALRAQIERADAIMLATPVYFGDRGSLANSLLELFREDPEFTEVIREKVYVGIAVGAKRNGGQETTLIYQIVDMLNAGLMCVGNDSETTSQYGGTVLAGDVGTAWKDEYGLNTSMGAGRRIARVAWQMRKGAGSALDDRLRVGFWVLQDRDGYCVDQVRKLAELSGDTIEAHIFDGADADITRCIACDICPTEVGVDAEYRCIIKKKTDYFKNNHERLVGLDAIVPVGIAPRERAGVRSMYQQFMERTRYLRRGDYLFTDLLTAPIVFEEVGANDCLGIRMLTSTLRHHTVMSRPLTGYLWNGRLINRDELVEGWRAFVGRARRLAAGRLIAAAEHAATVQYNPVGYVLSAAKDKEAETLRRRQKMAEDRAERASREAEVRLTSSVVES